MVGAGYEMCYNAVCQSPTTDHNSDLDLDSETDTNAAWAGIAVVIVVVGVGVGVWLAIRRKKRARGGHNSVDAGPSSKRRIQIRFPRFWRRSLPDQPPETSMELGGNDDPKERRNSTASNLKRTTTSGTTDVIPPPAAKLSTGPKEGISDPGQYPMLPLHRTQSAETVTSIPEPLPARIPSRDSSSSHRSSLSRLSIPPPGLGPPAHQPDPAPAPAPRADPSTSSQN